MSFIREVVQRVIDTAAGESDDFCVSLESRANIRHWLQITSCYVNLAYPFADAPTSRLPSLGIEIPASFELNGWEPNSHVTFEHDFEGIEEISAFARGKNKGDSHQMWQGWVFWVELRHASKKKGGQGASA